MFAVWPACNGADGISDIEGKVTRGGASECGQRASFNRDRDWWTNDIGVHRCLVVATRAPLLIGSTSWKSTLLLAPVLIYYVLMKLRLVVEHDSETKRWAAFFPELPGCASAGDTEDEAIQNAKEALELWFEPAPVDLPAGAKVLEVALT
jgi:predicted RNase H-like HicB family nuclease